MSIESPLGGAASTALRREGKFLKYHHIGIPTTKNRPGEFLSFDSEDRPLNTTVDGNGISL
ncbi:MAG: hypothetical protein DRJ61_12085 [Acidobacteria bacterium]|nr:MAG: hypothetical protein DRJ61_12085 [Acidobacteriota bacterium]